MNTRRNFLALLAGAPVAALAIAAPLAAKARWSTPRVRQIRAATITASHIPSGWITTGYIRPLSPAG